MVKKNLCKKILMLACCLLTLSGCSDESPQEPLNVEMPLQTSCYQYEEISVFEDLSVQAMEKLEDKYVVLCEDQNGALVEYTSTDQGKSWDKNVIEIDLLQQENAFVSKSDVSAAGDYAALVVVLDEENQEQYRRVLFLGKEETRVIAEYVGKNIDAVCFDETGDSLLVSTGNEVEEYKTDGTLLHTYPVTHPMDICFMENQVLFLTTNSLMIYDQTSGDLVSEDTSMAECLGEDLAETAKRSDSDALNDHKIMRPGEDGKVYFLLSTGMYCHVPGSSVIECIYQAKDIIGAVSSQGCINYLREGDIFYLIDFDDNHPDYRFMSCRQSTETVVTAEEDLEEITVYTLYEQQYIDEVIKAFEIEYPNIKVTVEVGRVPGSSTTVTEAVNALNTELLAGNGPDIIILDDLNYISYRDNGMLADLSGLYEEILEENPDCNTSILSCFRTENGELYALPSQFSCQVILGPKDTIPSLNSPSALADYIRNSNCNPEFGNDLRIYDYNVLFKMMYPAYSPKIFGDGTVYDKQELENFVSGYKEVWDALMEHTTEELILEWEAAQEQELVDLGYTGRLDCNNTYLSFGLTDVVYGNPVYEDNMQAKTGRSIGLFCFSFGFDIFDILDITRDYTDDTYDIFSYDDTHTFTPLFVLSVNAKSEHRESAETLIRYMLSSEMQSKIAVGFYDPNYEHRPGLPVNREGMRQYYDNYAADCVDAQETNPGFFTFLGDEQEYYMSVLDTLTVPAYRDALLEEKILENMEDYLTDEITLEQYMEKTDNAIRLYMEE